MKRSRVRRALAGSVRHVQALGAAMHHRLRGDLQHLHGLRTASQEVVRDVQQQLEDGVPPLRALDDTARKQLGKLDHQKPKKLFLVLAATTVVCGGTFALAKRTITFVTRRVPLVGKPVTQVTNLLLPAAVYVPLVAAYMAAAAIRGARQHQSQQQGEQQGPTARAAAAAPTAAAAAAAAAAAVDEKHQPAVVPRAVTGVPAAAVQRSGTLHDGGVPSSASQQTMNVGASAFAAAALKGRSSSPQENVLSPVRPPTPEGTWPSMSLPLAGTSSTAAAAAAGQGSLPLSPGRTSFTHRSAPASSHTSWLSEHESVGRSELVSGSSSSLASAEPVSPPAAVLDEVELRRSSISATCQQLVTDQLQQSARQVEAMSTLPAVVARSPVTGRGACRVTAAAAAKAALSNTAAAAKQMLNLPGSSNKAAAGAGKQTRSSQPSKRNSPRGIFMVKLNRSPSDASSTSSTGSPVCSELSSLPPAAIPDPSAATAAAAMLAPAAAGDGDSRELPTAAAAAADLDPVEVDLQVPTVAAAIAALEQQQRRTQHGMGASVSHSVARLSSS